ncbi:MAG TPA: urease accessory protein UreE [Polyangiaceae bacterium]
MLTFAERVPAHPVHDDVSSSSPLATLTLPYDARQKSRFRAWLDDGREAAVMLPRGTVLRHGDLLLAEDGTRVTVRAEPERVSVATAADALSALRAAYHLGNRHVPLQIAEQQLIYRHDHVLDAMLEQLGLRVSDRLLPFEPETGAYGHSHTAHAHAAEPEHETPRMPEPDIPTRLELARPLRQR